jgi:hypothetical protein
MIIYFSIIIKKQRYIKFNKFQIYNIISVKKEIYKSYLLWINNLSENIEVDLSVPILKLIEK